MEHNEFFHDLELVLASKYNTPDLGNYQDPLDELIFISLCTKTAPNNVSRAFNSLKQLGSWNDVLSSPVGQIANRVRAAGITGNSEVKIRGILHSILEKTGQLDLSFLHELQNDDVESFLKDLPGVGPKITYCVMLFSLQRDVFPVDTHIARIMKRLAVVAPELKPELISSSLAALIPPGSSYSLHVNLIAHGRSTCRANQPKCTTCCINQLCAYAGHHRINRI